LFAAVATDIGLWYLAQSLYGLFQASIWARLTAVLAILLPQFTLHFFDAIVPRSGGAKAPLLRFARALAVPMLVLAVLPQSDSSIARVVIFLYAFGLLAAGLWSLAVRGQKSGSRATKRRVSFLVVIGALAATFSLADFSGSSGPICRPSARSCRSCSCFCWRSRCGANRLLRSLRDGRPVDGVDGSRFPSRRNFYVFVTYLGRFKHHLLERRAFAIVILVLFEPLRAWVENRIHGVFFRERPRSRERRWTRRVAARPRARSRRARQVVTTALEKSRHATSAASTCSTRWAPRFDFAAGIGSNVPQAHRARVGAPAARSRQWGPGHPRGGRARGDRVGARPASYRRRLPRKRSSLGHGSSGP